VPVRRVYIPEVGSLVRGMFALSRPDRNWDIKKPITQRSACSPVHWGRGAMHPADIGGRYATNPGVSRAEHTFVTQSARISCSVT
jgi:hypothetical protein